MPQPPPIQERQLVCYTSMAWTGLLPPHDPLAPHTHANVTKMHRYALTAAFRAPLTPQYYAMSGINSSPL